VRRLARLSVAEAKRFCRLVEECNLAWFEEPVTADDKRGQAEVPRHDRHPDRLGRERVHRHDFRDLAILGAVDIMQPDLAICGGITEAMRISALASAHNLRLAPHLWAGAPAFAAGLHVAAASPAGFIVEYSLGANPLLHDLVEEDFPVKDGMIEVPEAARARHHRARGFLKSTRSRHETSCSSAGLLLRKSNGSRRSSKATSNQRRCGGRATGSTSRPRFARPTIIVSEAWRAGMPAAPRLEAAAVAGGRDRQGRDGGAAAWVTVCNAYGHEMAMAEYAVMAMLVWSHRYSRSRSAFAAARGATAAS